MATRAVFFDVDFTLIYPGPTFQAEGYERFCRKRGIDIDSALFPHAVAAASALLSVEQDHVYDAAIFVRYTRRIIEAMGDGSGVVMLDGKMQDDATWKQAKVVVDLARIVAAKDPDLAARYGL